MGTKDPRVTAYVEKAPAFAKPILRHLRAVVHAACPEVEETVKWRMPWFVHHGLLGGMAAFRAHCALWLWRGRHLPGTPDRAEAMGQFGRIGSLADLPPRATQVKLVREAARRNEAGEPSPRARRAAPAVRVPPDLAAALAKRANARARATFRALSPGKQRDYAVWIAEARREETRARRLASALAWLAEGKSQNWRYERG
jgi:uncharacterized protein YdeI (YjbR/CyaY-like superfamily)